MATSHVFQNGYKSNDVYFKNDGVTINGVHFTDFSSYSGRGQRSFYGTLMAPPSGQKIEPTNLEIQNAISDYAQNGGNSFDHMNKILGMMFTNWNGAEIKCGNFNNGETVVISTTPEFLSIFNDVTSTLYRNVVKYINVTNRIKRGKVKTQDIAAALTITSISEVLDDYEILNIIYNNTTNSEKLITINQNANVSDNSGCKFIVPNGNALYVMIQPYGFGEISFLRRGNKIYVRGI